MKRWMVFFSLLLAACLLTACGSPAPAPTAALDTAEPAATAAPARPKVDIDLIHMSDTMAKAQITDMTENNPEKYVGKTVLAQGRYYYINNARMNLMDHYLLIGDELTCCAQLLEFVLEDGVFPDSYPQLDGPLTVEGVFQAVETPSGTVYAIVTDHLM